MDTLSGRENSASGRLKTDVQPPKRRTTSRCLPIWFSKIENDWKDDLGG